MKAIFFGFCLSAIVGVVAAILMKLGSFFGFSSAWCPLFWPGFVYGLAGAPFLLLLDVVPQANQVATFFFPNGGASGVFGILIGGALLVWSGVFSCAIHFWQKTRRRP